MELHVTSRDYEPQFETLCGVFIFDTATTARPRPANLDKKRSTDEDGGGEPSIENRAHARMRTFSLSPLCFRAVEMPEIIDMESARAAHVVATLKRGDGEACPCRFSSLPSHRLRANYYRVRTANLRPAAAADKETA